MQEAQAIVYREFLALGLMGNYNHHLLTQTTVSMTHGALPTGILVRPTNSQSSDMRKILWVVIFLGRVAMLATACLPVVA